MTSEQQDNLTEIGKGAMSCLADMVAALECDYDRLEELRDERDGYDEHDDKCGQSGNWALDNADDAEELAALELARGECEDREDAEQRIHEDPLSVEVRSDWVTPGEKMTPGEFCILLSTGGPATRITGDLNEHGEPCRARLEAQDWFTPWQEYVNADRDVLLTYARCFFFGE